MSKASNIIRSFVAGAGCLAVVSIAATKLIDARNGSGIAAESSRNGQSLYERHVKRPLDFACSLVALMGLSPIMGVTALLVRAKLGSPVIFRQKRPGIRGEIFEIYKFRSMTDERDENGELLPDEVRLTSFGRRLRETSLDELPELINILKGDMAVVGPRPQLVRDLVFMSAEQKRRQSVLPGLTGLAQVKGRNDISWDEKLSWDIAYLNDISFVNDLKIIYETFKKAVLVNEGVSDGVHATALDYGEALLAEGRIDEGTFNEKMVLAKEMLDGGQ